ncbi:MAG: AIR synthase family protein [Clostridiales bacterium]|nr:AIR synthase family protein [Clostridiales bacterium]MDD7034861.1 AIR synthase family protein [Bacillota bacterium]MDY2920437.1 AIR synthase family protein [Lentihominibacter sp.]
MILETGKLDSDILKKIVFDKIKYKSPLVKVRPGIGEDCAVMDFGDFDCVMSTDPISSAVSDIGKLAIHITCNDIASNGVQPLGIMLAVMLPEGTTDDDVEHIMAQASEEAAALGVEIIGGHTEVTGAVNQPVIVSTAIGRGPAGSSQSGDNMVPGDYIVMTKAAGLEGSGIIACDYAEQLKAAEDDEGNLLFTEDEIAEAGSFLNRVSVLKEGVAAGKVGTHGMHDITEGGVLGAVWEMCCISETGAEVWEDEIPLEDVTRKICDFYRIDPYRLISSGSMLIVVPEDKKDEMMKAMEDAGIGASVIGRIRDKSQGIKMVRRVSTCGAEGLGRIAVTVDPPRMDELYKVIKEEK